MTFAAVTRDVELFAVQCKKLVTLTGWISPRLLLLMQQRTSAPWREWQNLWNRILCTCPLCIFNIFSLVAEMATHTEDVFTQTLKRFWENSARHLRPERPLLRWWLILSRPNWKARSMFDMALDKPCHLYPYGKIQVKPHSWTQWHVSDAETLWSRGGATVWKRAGRFYDRILSDLVN